MQWINPDKLSEPGWYWKCWRDAKGDYHLIDLEKLTEFEIDCHNMNLYSYLFFYGPLEIPPPPLGDVWGV